MVGTDWRGGPEQFEMCGRAGPSEQLENRLAHSKRQGTHAGWRNGGTLVARVGCLVPPLLRKEPAVPHPPLPQVFGDSTAQASYSVRDWKSRDAEDGRGGGHCAT